MSTEQQQLDNMVEQTRAIGDADGDHLARLRARTAERSREQARARTLRRGAER